MSNVTCPYCSRPAVLTDSKEVYRQSHGFIWICRPCKAWVGTHKTSPTHKPLGRLANAELRDAKKLAHKYFDPLWERKLAKCGGAKHLARNAGYQWLAKQLNIPLNQCHIGMLDVDQCRAVIEVCKPYLKK